MEKLERIPEEGDNFEHENLTVTVTKADERRVLEVVIALKREDTENT